MKCADYKNAINVSNANILKGLTEDDHGRFSPTELSTHTDTVTRQLGRQSFILFVFKDFVLGYILCVGSCLWGPLRGKEPNKELLKMS